jgi:hypothetical protein
MKIMLLIVAITLGGCAQVEPEGKGTIEQRLDKLEARMNAPLPCPTEEI